MKRTITIAPTNQMMLFILQLDVQTGDHCRCVIIQKWEQWFRGEAGLGGFRFRWKKGHHRKMAAPGCMYSNHRSSPAASN
jgi:hypothetical protein